MSEISIRSLSGSKTAKPWPKRSCTKALGSWGCGSRRASLVPSRRQVPSERARDVVLTAGQATLDQEEVGPQHVGTRAPGRNQATRHWHTGSMRTHRLRPYAGRGVYECPGD